MKKLHILACGALAMTAALTSCQNEVFDDIKKDADLQDQYMKAWIDKFGKPDPNHDWCMLRAVDADIEISAIGGASAQIYDRAPQQGGHLIGIADGDTRLVLDLQKSSSEVYASVLDKDGNVISSVMYDVPESSVRIDGNGTPAPEGLSRYAHDPNNWFDAMIACEDMGSIGDFDFNDIVLGLRHVSGSKKLYITPMAAGGTLEAKVYFRNEEIGEIHSILKGEGASTKQMLNTQTYTIVAQPITVTLTDAEYRTFSVADSWRDFSLKIISKGDENSAVEIDANTKEDGIKAPQMICLGGDWYWPTETTGIDESYPLFKHWTNQYEISSQWYKNCNIDKVVVWNIDKVANWFSITNAEGVATYAKLYLDDASTLVDVSNVQSGVPYYITQPKNANSMFASYSKPSTSINVSAEHFDVSAVEDMGSMFTGNRELTEIIGTGNWNTGNVKNMYYMFGGCLALPYVDVSGWDMKNVLSINDMFYDCNALDNIDVSNWNFNGNNVDMLGAFEWCETISRIDISNWNAKPTSMKYMFDHCYNLSYLDMSNLDLTNLGGWSTSCPVYQIFAYSGIETLKMNNWVIPYGFDIAYMFSSSSFLKDFTIEAKNWDCKARTIRDRAASCPSLSGWFGYKDITSIDVTGWLTNGVQCMYQLFVQCKKLTTITGINGWDVSTVKDFGNMFNGCKSLTSLDLSNWNPATASNMEMMFNGCEELTSLDLSGWKPADIHYIYNMFSGCKKLTTLDLSNMVTTYVNSVGEMFKGCEKLEYLYIDKFDMTNINAYYNMLMGVNPELKIRCTSATRTWLINHASDIGLPDKLNPSSSDYDATHWLPLN